MLYRDCIFYKYSGTPNWRDMQSNSNDNYCSFSCDSYEGEILQASIAWSDPIKVRDKIITSERKTIKFFVFKENKVICIFGGSESQMAYTISKLFTFFSISLKKINIFESYKQKTLKSTFFKGLTLTSLDIAKQQSGFDNSTYINISVNDIEKNNLAKYINSPEILSLIILYKEKQIYFSLDVFSVVSFFDTDEFNSIFEVCRRIVVDIV
ncbi:hypothetical protein BGM26_03015 [Bacillus sp. FJAT-29790]|uniref:hypothetical protein n=1 Tax=Bacillus sp. FJAT-29790 TaxID=1895002 RepID=UPI001C22FC8A|nr:hypothetical protein [Bacillus sp. FJAT-29790]MBU8877963.1 hypothetical protein [Bacillus sp. FJAT-29790]